MPVDEGVRSPIAPPKWQNAIWAADCADDGSIFVAPAWSGLYRIAPDGKTIEIVADLDAAKKEVNFVMEFDPASPGPGLSIKVSQSQAQEPVWSIDGRILYYRSVDGRRIFSVPISQNPLSAGRETLVLDKLSLTNWGWLSYDIHPDGKRFIMQLSDEPASDTMTLVVVQNWFEELRQKFAMGK